MVSSFSENTTRLNSIINETAEVALNTVDLISENITDYINESIRYFNNTNRDEATNSPLLKSDSVDYFSASFLVPATLMGGAVVSLAVFGCYVAYKEYNFKEECVHQSIDDANANQQKVESNSNIHDHESGFISETACIDMGNNSDHPTTYVINETVKESSDHFREAIKTT